MRKEFRTKLKGDDSRVERECIFHAAVRHRDFWGKAKVPVKVTINAYTWRSTVGNRGGVQYIVVNANARRSAGVKAGDFVTIALEPDTEKREIEIPELRTSPGAKFTFSGHDGNPIWMGKDARARVNGNGWPGETLRRV